MTNDVARVICYVVENVSEETARRRVAATAEETGWLRSTVEDRTSLGDGWACVSYFTPESGHYGYQVLLPMSKLSHAAQQAVRPEARPERHKTYIQRRFEEYLARQRRTPAPVFT